MGLITKIKKAFKKKEDKDKDGDVSNGETNQETLETKLEKQEGVSKDQIRKLIENSKNFTSIDRSLGEISTAINEIKKDMAKEETLKEVKDDVVNKSTMKDLLENYMLKQAMEYFQGNVSKQETAPVSKENDNVSNEETKEFIRETSKKKAEEFTEELEEIEKYQEAKKKVLRALKGRPKTKFGNDEGSYGLTKLTGLSRSWIYKVSYLGFDSSGSIKNPAENTLLEEEKINIDTSGRAFKVEIDG